MTADSEKDLQYLKAIGRLCVQTRRTLDHAITARSEHTIVVTKTNRSFCPSAANIVHELTFDKDR